MQLKDLYGNSVTKKDFAARMETLAKQFEQGTGARPQYWFSSSGRADKMMPLNGSSPVTRLSKSCCEKVTMSPTPADLEKVCTALSSGVRREKSAVDGVSRAVSTMHRLSAHDAARKQVRLAGFKKMPPFRANDKN